MQLVILRKLQQFYTRLINIATYLDTSSFLNNKWEFYSLSRIPLGFKKYFSWTFFENKIRDYFIGESSNALNIWKQ